MYKQFDFDGNEVSHHDLQDKSVWCKDGENIEQGFIDKYGSKLQLVLNPEKEINPYAPDLLRTNDKRTADLKTQNTPFFKAGEFYDIDPPYAIVFNIKDSVRYSDKYPDIIIYFWVNWMVERFVMNEKEIFAKKISGVWMIEFKNALQLIKSAPIHEYIQRRYDMKGNAKGSYVFDLRNELFKQVI